MAVGPESRPRVPEAPARSRHASTDRGAQVAESHTSGGVGLDLARELTVVEDPAWLVWLMTAAFWFAAERSATPVERAFGGHKPATGRGRALVQSSPEALHESAETGRAVMADWATVRFHTWGGAGLCAKSVGSGVGPTRPRAARRPIGDRENAVAMNPTPPEVWDSAP